MFDKLQGGSVNGAENERWEDEIRQVGGSRLHWSSLGLWLLLGMRWGATGRILAEK